MALVLAPAAFAQSTSFQYFYDDANELFRVIDSTGTMIEYDYDPAGNIIQIQRTTVSSTGLAIFNISGLMGSWGSTMTIIGQGFSTIAANDIVQINGLTVIVLSATSTQIVVLIPPNATSGQVTVTVNGVTVSSGPSLIFTPVSAPTNYAVAAILSVQNGVLPGAIPSPGQNETPYTIFSVLNGQPPGTMPVTGTNEVVFPIFSVGNNPTSLPTGTNEATANIFSVLNGTIPGSTPTTGMNEAPFWIFSVQNGSIPGTTPVSGMNEAPFWIFSVLNGTIPGSTLMTGLNEADFPLFSVGNDQSNSPSLRTPAALTSVAGTASATTNAAHVMLPAANVSAGQTLQIAAALDTPAPGTTVEFFINGESFGTYAPPYQFPLTIPYTVSSLRVIAVAGGVTSQEAAIGVTPESGTRLRGRVAGADGAPASGKTVSLVYSGLRAELFHFATPLLQMPDLTGLKPVAERAVSSLDLRNPGGVFGNDPLGTGLAPDYVVRFSASLRVDQEGDYIFSLRGQQGVSLRVAGETVTDGGKVHLVAGSTPLEALAFVGAGALEVQLLWQPPGQLLQPVPDGVLWSKEPALHAVTDLSGQFEFMAVPSSLGLVKVVADDVASEPTPASAGDVGILIERKTVQ
jgi:YD repeat-containing protein